MSILDYVEMHKKGIGMTVHKYTQCQLMLIKIFIYKASLPMNNVKTWTQKESNRITAKQTNIVMYS